MIQDIFPNRLDNQYVECSPQDNDVIFFFEGSSLLAKYIKEDTLTYPLYKQFIQGIKTGISKDSVDNYSLHTFYLWMIRNIFLHREKANY